MTYAEIKAMQDELDQIENTLSLEAGVPGCERLYDKASRLQDELDEAKAGLPSRELREWGIRA